MNQHSETISSSKKARAKKEKNILQGLVSKQTPSDIWKGIVFLFLGYLLGQCGMWFGTRPLGIAFLCAGSVYTWYILIGLVLSAVLSPGSLPVGAYLAVYALVILLRLLLLFLVDSKHPLREDSFAKKRKQDRLGIRRDMRTVSDHWHAFTQFLPHGQSKTEPYEDASEYYAAPCSMLHNPPSCPSDPGDTRPASESVRVSRSVDPTESTERTSIFEENIFLRMLTGSVAGFALGLFAMVRGGFQVYDLLGALTMVFAVPLSTFLWIPVFHEEGRRLLFAECPPKPGSRERHIPMRDKTHPPYTAFSTVSVLLLLSVAVYAARSLSISFGSGFVGIYAAPAMALLLSLVAAKYLGIIPSVVVALFTGVAAQPTLVPAFLLAVLIYALVRLASDRIAVFSAYTAALFWCYLSGGVTGLVHLFPSFLVGITAYFIGERIRELFPTAVKTDTAGLTDFAVSVAQRLQHEAAQQRMSSLSNAFSSLSELFYNLSDKLRHPRDIDYRRACQAVFDKNCAACRHRKDCWGQAYERTDEAMDAIVRRLVHHGRINADHLPTAFRDACPRSSSIVEQINASIAHMTEVLMRSEKTEVFASDYQAISSMLEMAARADREEYQLHKETADRLFRYLNEQGIAVQGVVVCGKRERHITVRGRHFERVRKKATEIKTKIEEICGVRLRDPVFEKEDEYTVMTLASLPRMTTSYSGSTVPADLEEGRPLPGALTGDLSGHDRYTPPTPCGDHIAIFANEQAYFYALISDGMGSGPDASFTSDICAIFLEKMLSAGNHAEVSVKMLNNFIRSKNVGSGDECSATVDLMELDLHNGHALFVKSGAAPTYVVRSGTVYKLHSRTVPIGIFKDSEPELLRFRMHPGDVIVMVSDGVTHGNDECPWLIDLLSDPLPSSMDSLRSDILKRAITSGSPDDLSAIAVRVEDAQK